MRVFLFAFILLVSAQAWAKPYHHPFGEMREEVQDWLAICPDEHKEEADYHYYTSCFASTGAGGMNDAGKPNYTLTLLRNRKTQELGIALTFDRTDGAHLDTTKPVVLQFDALQPHIIHFDDLKKPYEKTQQYFVKDDELTQSFYRTMMKGKKVYIAVPIKQAGQQTTMDKAAFSLMGVRGAMMFIDAYQ